MEGPVEYITWDRRLLACVVRTQLLPRETTFVTEPAVNLQVGFVVYPAGGEVAPHVHCPIERNLVGTSEVLIVKRGRCAVDIYNDAGQVVASPVLGEGDLIIVTGGGHGCRMLEDTVLLEVKQGPYEGPDEKVPLRTPGDRTRS